MFIKTLVTSVLFGISSLAGAQSTSGSIVGDADPSDSITIIGTSNGFKREIKVDQDGKYKARNIPIGSYSIIVARKNGSMNTVTDILVRPGAAIRVPAPASPTDQAPLTPTGS